MAVFRVEKTRDYTVMANHHLKNKALSLKAKGLLSIMLSLPETWNYTTRGLAAICREGVDSISSTLRELEKAGYVVRYRLRDERGRITDTEYVIYETPRAGTLPDTPSPDTENPYMDEPYADRPHPGDPVQYIPYPKNTDKSKTYSENPYPSNPHPYSGASVSDVRVQVRENIGYDCLATEENREQLDGIVELLTEVLCTRRSFIRISGVDYPAQMVKERFGQINSLHIQYVFECLENTASRIRNIRQYLLATLFNAPVTKGSYYDARVRYDRSLGWLCPPAKAAQV